MCCQGWIFYHFNALSSSIKFSQVIANTLQGDRWQNTVKLFNGLPCSSVLYSSLCTLIMQTIPWSLSGQLPSCRRNTIAWPHNTPVFHQKYMKPKACSSRNKGAWPVITLVFHQKYMKFKASSYTALFSSVQFFCIEIDHFFVTLKTVMNWLKGTKTWPIV